jgi:phosphopantetheinyl transferase (holo-ACP synthase)
MIGNDIIDLSQARAESNWRRKGWVNKIFSKQEQKFIALSTEKELIVWLMWSMKEAAYKAYHREFKEMFYAPQKFSSHNISIKDNKAKGSIYFEQNIYHTSSIITPDLIHTIAAVHNNSSDTIVYIEDKTNPPATCRQAYNLFKDEHGIPYDRDHRNRQIKNASKSHHGRFEAIVIW